MPNLPLDGVRIISFEQYGAAPYATMFLADFGAEVIKVEGARGDFARHSGPKTLGADDSLYYQTFNLNKKSMVLDLRKDGDKALFHDMVADCDVVVNNLRGSLPAKLEIDFANLKTANPAVICGHISAYGREGSRADWPGYDFLMQAEAGFMALTGEPDANPVRIGLSMIDYMTGMMMAFSIASALRGVAKTGEGCDIDVSLFDAALHQLAYQGSWYMNEGVVTPRQKRAAHPSNAPSQLYTSKGGWIYVCCMNDKFWQILIDEIGREDLGSDERFATMAARHENGDALTEILDAVFAQRTSHEWMDKLGGKIPVAPVEDLPGALDNPFVAEADMIATLPHRSGRDIHVLRNPIRIDGERLPQRAAPALDEHGDEVRERVAARTADAT